MYQITRSFTEVRTGREFRAGDTFKESPFDATRLAAYIHRGWIVEVPDKPAETGEKKDGE